MRVGQRSIFATVFGAMAQSLFVQIELSGVEISNSLVAGEGYSESQTKCIKNNLQIHEITKSAQRILAAKAMNTLIMKKVLSLCTWT